LRTSLRAFFTFPYSFPIAYPFLADSYTCLRVTTLTEDFAVNFVDANVSDANYMAREARVPKGRHAHHF
jgi:hypothetical protein